MNVFFLSISLTFCCSPTDDQAAQISCVQSWHCPVSCCRAEAKLWNLRSDFSEGLSPIQLMQGQPKIFYLSLKG